MLRQRITTSLLALGLFTAGTGFAHAQYNQGPPPPPPGAYNQGPGGWDAPPQEFSEVRRKGYLDGIEGAKQDFKNHRQPNVNNRDEYRHPDVHSYDRKEYRMGFRRGYDVGVRHIYGGGRNRY